MGGGRSLFLSIVKVRVAGWWSFSLSPSIVNVRPLSVFFYRKGEGCWVVGGWVVVSLCFLLYSGKGGWVVVSLSLFPSIVKVRVAGWWPLSLSPSILNVRPLSLCLLLYRPGEGCWAVGGWVVVSVCLLL